MASHQEGYQPVAWVATQLGWVGRQLLLVPEAVLLLALLCLHSTFGAPPILAALGLVITLYFVARTTLIALGQHAFALADYERALKVTHAAIAMYPGSADAHALAGSIHLARGRSSMGAEAFRRAVACYPLQSDLHAALSAALLDDGRPQEAREEAFRALELDPHSAVAHLHLAGAEEALGAARERVEATLRAGLACAAPAADEATLRCALAALLLEAGRRSEAQLVLVGTERLLARCPAPQRAGLHFHLGELLRASDADAARGHFSASEQLDPNGRFAAAAWRAARS
jgi:tetratricopeptide (TPR) repeat protein